MNPDIYDAWYDTARGRWIGETEFRLLLAQLCPMPGATVLDAGCGTGYFTRQLTRAGLRVTGIDSDRAAIAYAQRHAAADETYLVGDARALTFPDRHFDYVVAMTSLCFIADDVQALAEMARVARRRIALGLLNRRSLLYRQKGRGGGAGAYRGAHWHTPREVHRLFAQAGLPKPTLRSAIFLPGGSPVAQRIEGILPQRMLLGAFLLAVADLRAD